MTSTAPPDRTTPADGTMPPDGSLPADRPDQAPPPRGPDRPTRPESTRPPGWTGRLVAAARRPSGMDAGVALLYLLFALWVTGGLWPDPGARVFALNPEDQTLYEWFLANDTRIFRGDFHLVTDRLNAPEGVNLLANTSVIALGVLFAPVTLAFGAPATFAVIAGLNLALTALAWYLVFARLLRAHRFAAVLGGAFCGFAPGMVSQNNAHLHMTAQWLVPAMVWCVVAMVRAADPEAPGEPAHRTRRLVRAAVGLAALVTVQVFIGEEVLFLTALTLLLVTLGYAAARRRLARRVAARFLGGMALATLLAGAALAYPLWTQFAGPQFVRNGIFSAEYFSADLASWATISPMSLAGSEDSARLSTGPAEYNTFLGWPLIVAAVGCAVWLWRRPLVIACAAAGLVMGSLSLGPQVVINGERTSVVGPYALIHNLPIIDGALPMRFALPLIPLIATILVLAVDRALRDSERVVRIAVPVAVVAALLPVAPLAMPTEQRPPLPAFVTAGHWRECVPPGGVLVPVPLPTPRDPWPMRWGAAVNAEFAMPEGFFIGPYGARGKGSMGTFKQPTSQWLEDIAKGTPPPVMTDAHRAQVRADLAFWGASCVALADDAPNADALRATLEALLGPGTRTADVWTWKVG